MGSSRLDLDRPRSEHHYLQRIDLDVANDFRYDCVELVWSQTRISHSRTRLLTTMENRGHHLSHVPHVHGRTFSALAKHAEQIKLASPHDLIRHQSAGAPHTGAVAGILITHRGSMSRSRGSIAAM